jgi:hypothetical protein
MKTATSFRTLGAVYVAFALAFTLAALLTHVLGQKMIDSMVQLMGALVLP